MKHKHAELIHAWADGAEIQVWNGDILGWSDESIDYIDWQDNYQYRIKPEVKQPVVRWKCAYKREDGRWLEVEHFYTQEEITKEKSYIKLEYTRTEFLE